MTHPPAATTITDLSAFQRDILAVLAAQAQYGLGIKDELDRLYGTDTNHGRLYPNLDELAEQGLVEKSELDKRTNEYALTNQGWEVLATYHDWLTDRLDEAAVDETERTTAPMHPIHRLSGGRANTNANGWGPNND